MGGRLLSTSIFPSALRLSRCLPARQAIGMESPAPRGVPAAAGDRDQAPPPPPPPETHSGPQQQQQPAYRVLSEEVLHKRYLTLYNRRVQFPGDGGEGEGPVLEFDIAGHPRCDFHFAVTFPYHSAGGGSVTLIREYAQGVNQLVYCLPTGGFEPGKHADYEACARAELSEEARLAGGTWLPLLPAEHPGVPEIKWGRNRFHAWLVLDPQPDVAPGHRDREELSIEVVRVSVPELRRLMRSGEMLLPSVATCFWALERIEELRVEGLLLPPQQPADGAPQQPP